MATARNLLFSWDAVDQLPDLRRLRLILEALPDGDLLEELEARRGRGRNDYPVRAMWRAVIAMLVFQHPSVEALVRELQRNPALLQVCGFDPLGRQGRCRRPAGGSNVVPFGPLRNGVPSAYNFSRFLRTVSEVEAERGLITAMTDAMRGDLLAELPGFGEHLGYDGKALPAHATGRTCPASKKPADR